MTVSPISHLSPKVERYKNPFGETCASFPQPNTSLEMLHVNPLGEPFVLGWQQASKQKCTTKINFMRTNHILGDDIIPSGCGSIA